MVMATSGGMVADDGRRCASTSSYPKTQPRTVSDRVVLTLVSSDELDAHLMRKFQHSMDWTPWTTRRRKSLVLLGRATDYESAALTD